MRATLSKESEGILYGKVSKHTRAAILSYFSFSESRSSYDFEAKIQDSLREVCQYYDEVIVSLFQQKIDGKTMDDWVSWYTDMLKTIQSSTIEKYAFSIMNHETLELAANAKVPAELGSRYYRTFCSFYKKAHQELKEYREIVPRSLKFIRKRQNRLWIPYPGQYDCLDVVHA